MPVSAGLVGLPNVGKSTLFNAITKSSVPAENYPFCTITPHVAITAVPDVRSEKLKAIYGSKAIIPATIEFVDIAGLVKGAASGEGLGNQFLGNIREVDLIIHVVRCFQDKDIIRLDPVDPLSDLEIIFTELILKDIEGVTKRQAKLGTLIKQAKSKPQELALLEKEQVTLEHVIKALNESNITALQNFRSAPELPKDLLLSSKNFIIVANISESELSAEDIAQNSLVQELIKKYGQDKVIPLSARIEGELAQLEPQEAQEMMSMLSMKASGINQLITATYQQLNRITFFTCGPQEIHAWPVTKGITIRKAAGEIHSDLDRGFICSEVISYKDLIAIGSETKLRADGKIRTEGQDYLVQDGDIINVRFNV